MKYSIQQCLAACCLLLFLSVFSVPAQAAYFQSSITVSGTVTDTEGEPLAGANIRVKGKVIGTSTDTQGRFELTVNLDTPFTIVVSIVGFTSQEFEITQSVDNLEVELAEQPIIGDDVVVSASRVEESILKSPVAIEKLDAIAIQSTPAPSFYDAILNLKGVDFSAQSLTFKSINTRGFAANGNTRFVQLIDGIDNQAPGLNFPVGNVVGISELDLESAELIPGVASALYGPNAPERYPAAEFKKPLRLSGFKLQCEAGNQPCG